MAKRKSREEVPKKWAVGEPPKKCVNCDFIGEAKAFTILIHPDVYGAIYHLTKKIEKEWQLLLTGTEREQEVYVTGYYVPKQTVTPSTVTNLDCIDDDFIEEHSVVATIHSHGNMGVFFSATDVEFTNTSKIRHHMVINNRHEVVAESRYDLPCKGYKMVTSDIRVLIPTQESVEGIEKIDVRTYVSHGSSYERAPYVYPEDKGGGGWGRESFKGKDKGRNVWLDWAPYVKDSEGVWIENPEPYAAEVSRGGSLYYD